MNLRPAIYARDHGVCRDCGHAVDPWQVHHVVATSEGGLDGLSNLATLCCPHHYRETARQNRRRAARARWCRFERIRDVVAAAGFPVRQLGLSFP